MAHFANIINGRVVAVIVAGQDFVNTRPGQWIKTSYNTKGGFHYDMTGRPDGGVELRKNFAAVGDVYDVKRDAFYRPPSSTFQYLEESTCNWIPCLPFQSARLNQDDPIGSNVRMYVSGKNTIDLFVRSYIIKSLGITLVTNPAIATNVLPFSNMELHNMANNATLNDITGMVPVVYQKISTRMGLLDLKIPALSTILPLSASDVSSLPATPIVVKHNIACFDGTGYVEYANPNEFLSKADATFWVNQNTPNIQTGAFVIQPLLLYPQTTLKIQISINAVSEVLVWAKSTQVQTNKNGSGSYVPFTGECNALIEQIKSTIHDLYITNSFHELEFTSINGVWTLINWNPHLSGPMIECFPMAYPVLNDPFLYMLGKPIENETSNLYYERRTYTLNTMSADANVIGLQMGLFTTINANTIECASIGDERNVVRARFSKFESICTLAIHSITASAQP